MTLWANETNGTVSCHDHAGAYLESAITARPKAKTHSTPLGVWYVMPADEVANMTAEFGVLCDGCRSGR